MNNSPPAISIKNASKSYKLYQTPSHRVKETFHPFRKKYSTIFHALKDITITVNPGETIGIVGKNGCGKSTLLQIVCGIMPPSSGEIQVIGRVSAILELGAGFDPEFSGRSNVYLNCSILGMKKVEIDDRIEDILEFADIGEFIDQPVKTYSSGMTMRLAFSIAINVDPVILVIDEALSVGDSAFQRKCFSKIKVIQKQGATILFVSHDANAVVELCDRAILLDQGTLLYSGSPQKAVSLYHKLLFATQDKIDSIRLSIANQTENASATNTETSQATGPLTEGITPQAYFNQHLLPKSTTWYEPNGAIIHQPHITTLNGSKVNVLVCNEDYYYTYEVQFLKNVSNVRFSMLIKTIRGFELGGYINQVINEDMHHVAKGSTAHVRLRFCCSLLPGTYFLNAGVMGIADKEDGYLHRVVDVAMFEIMPEKDIESTAIVDFGIVPLINLQPPN